MAKSRQEFTELRRRKHGINGLVHGALKPRKQDKRFPPVKMYAVVFFPKFTNIGKAELWSIHTISRSPGAARAKFMDATSGTWPSYAKAGWCVRKITISDNGNAE